MNTRIIDISCNVFLFLGMIITFFPENFAHAERSISPYCTGTSPVKKIWIDTREKEFVPNLIEINKDDCIELVLVATEGVNHDAKIDKSGITSEGAALINSNGKHIGRVLYRKNLACERCGKMHEGWFSAGEQVLLRFQANKTGNYYLRCRNGMDLTIAVSP